MASIKTGQTYIGVEGKWPSGALAETCVPPQSLHMRHVECTLKAPCGTGLAVATPEAVHLGSTLRESDVRKGETVPVIAWGPIPVPSVGPALGYWVKEGLGLVVHFPLGCVAKINTL